MIKGLVNSVLGSVGLIAFDKDELVIMNARIEGDNMSINFMDEGSPKDAYICNNVLNGLTVLLGEDIKL